MTDEQIKSLQKLRNPFPPEQISKLPKPTKAQTEDLKANINNGIRCGLCGGWHHKNTVHLDYVGHAALTARLLDVDPLWNWEPFAVDDNGSPKLDKDGGMWIRLTICSLTRLGYGDAEGKTGPSATKERIGDALRNAAMRFGAALDLWSKADLTKHDIADDIKPETIPVDEPNNKNYDDPVLLKWLGWIDKFTNSGATVDQFIAEWDKYAPAVQKLSKPQIEKILVSKREMEKFLMEKPA